MNPALMVSTNSSFADTFNLYKWAEFGNSGHPIYLLASHYGNFILLKLITVV